MLFWQIPRKTNRHHEHSAVYVFWWWSNASCRSLVAFWSLFFYCGCRNEALCHFQDILDGCWTVKLNSSFRPLLFDSNGLIQRPDIYYRECFKYLGIHLSCMVPALNQTLIFPSVFDDDFYVFVLYACMCLQMWVVLYLYTVSSTVSSQKEKKNKKNTVSLA